MSEVWTKEKYAAYMFSDHWKKLRQRKLDSIGGRYCQQCGRISRKRRYEVHHLRYRNVWDVELGDLVVLCEDCHKEVHEGKKEPELKFPDIYDAEKYQDKWKSGKPKVLYVPPQKRWYNKRKKHNRHWRPIIMYGLNTCKG